MARKHRREKTRFIYSRILDTLTCQECGEGHNATLDFHHLNPDTKDFSLSDMKSKDYSGEKMVEEMSKCAVLCANCHRKLHHIGVEQLNLLLRRENKYRLTKTLNLAINEWDKRKINPK